MSTKQTDIERSREAWRACAKNVTRNLHEVRQQRDELAALVLAIPHGIDPRIRELARRYARQAVTPIMEGVVQVDMNAPDAFAALFAILGGDVPG